MSRYDRLIEDAKRQLNVAGDLAPLDLDGEEVQMSVRIPADLRDAVNDMARRRGQTLTGLVTELLVTTVRADRDPFVGLASDLADHIRAELATAVAAGDYQRAAAEVDAEDAVWADH